MSSHSQSFTILVPFSPSNRKPSKKINTPNTQRPLSTIIAENEIREYNLEYQQLLIHRKELEIEMQQKKNKFDNLTKRRKKAQKLLQQATVKRNQALLQCKQKRCYLRKYYDELDRKFKAGKEDLFASLTKLQQSLLEAYQKDQRRLKDSLSTHEEQFNHISNTLQSQKEKRDSLLEQLSKMQMQLNRSSFGGSKFEKGGLEELRNQNIYFQSEIERMRKQQKLVLNQERILKDILDIESLHRRHSSQVIKGIKRAFTIKLKEQKYKSNFAQQAQKGLQKFKIMINQKRAEKSRLTNQLAQKKASLDIISRARNEKQREYGQLQAILIRQENK